MNLPWQSVLVIYREIDVRIDSSEKVPVAFRHGLSDKEVTDAVRSFTAFPALVEELSHGEATMESRVTFADRPLQTLSPLGQGNFWPSPDDTRPEFRLCGTRIDCHSFFVFWPQTDTRTGRAIPSGGWGLGMGPARRWRNMTYAAIANAPTWAWDRPRLGEVWLHEWLHGACDIFRKGGCPLPDGDADGGGRHGYLQSPVTGWCDYYRDLMIGNVMENGVRTGISAPYWRAWTRFQE